jgi:hypothetical protein
MGRTERIFSYVFWGLALLVILIAIGISGWQITTAMLSVALIGLFLLLGVCTVIGIGLAWVYRRALARWPAWLLVLALFLISALAIQGTLRIPEPRLSLILSLLFPTSSAALLTAIILMLVRRDIGARVMGVASVVGIWTMVAAQRSQGDFVAAMLSYLATGKPYIIWWFNLTGCLTVGIVLLAGLSFAWHTIRLLIVEFVEQWRGAS